MNENVTKRREWVKNAAIIFLSIMLVLTFFSNTIMNYSLPEVATKYVERNSITAKVRGTGNVEATDPYNVKVTESRVISSVAVKQGDEIAQDAVLYYLEDAESEELKKAQDELDAMILAYMQQLFDGTTTPDVINKVENGNTDSFNTYKTKIANTQSQLEAAENSVTSSQNVVDNLNKQIKLLENSAAPNAEEEQKAVEDATVSLQNAQTAKSKAENKITELESKVKDLSAKVAESAALAGSIDEQGNVVGGLDNYQTILDAAKSKLSTEEGALLNVIKKYIAEVSIDIAVNESEIKKRFADANLGEDQYNKAVSEYTAQLNLYKIAKASLSAAQAEYDAAVHMLNKYSSYVKELAEAENELSKAKKTLNNETQNVLNAQNSLANAELILDNKENDTGNDSAKQNLNKQLIEAEAALSLAKTNLELVKADQVTLLANIQAELDLENKNSAIADKKEEIEKLKEKTEGAAVKSPVAGTVTSLAYVAGETMNPDQPAAVIQVAGKGFTVSFAVTNEQAKKVGVGDVAELQNAWYYNDVKAILASIKPDPDNPGQKKLLTFDVSGSELQAGEALNLSVGQRSQEYELVVPNSAIREDNNGKFILTIESKSSPFGNRFIATRVDVEELASDDTNTAISGALYGYESVITTATKPVEAGKQVRFAE